MTESLTDLYQYDNERAKKKYRKVLYNPLVSNESDYSLMTITNWLNETVDVKLILLRKDKVCRSFVMMSKHEPDEDCDELWKINYIYTFERFRKQRNAMHILLFIQELYNTITYADEDIIQFVLWLSGHFCTEVQDRVCIYRSNVNTYNSQRKTRYLEVLDWKNRQLAKIKEQDIDTDDWKIQDEPV